MFTTMTNKIIVYKPTNKLDDILDLAKLGLVIFAAIFVAVTIFSIAVNNVHAAANMTNETERSLFIDSYVQNVTEEIMKSEGIMIEQYVLNISTQINNGSV